MSHRLSCLYSLLALILVTANLSADDVSDSATERLPKGALLRMGSSRLAHGTWLTCVRFSADDRRIGVADSDGIIRPWDAATGELVWEKPQVTGRELAFSPDGKMLAIGGYYNQVITLWDLERDEEIRELPQTPARSAFPRTAGCSPPRAATRSCGCGARSPAS